MDFNVPVLLYFDTDDKSENGGTGGAFLSFWQELKIEAAEMRATRKIEYRF